MPAIFLCRSAGAKKTNTRRKPIGYSTERKENDSAVIVCNQEAKLKGMEGNRTLYGDVIAGPMYIVGEDTDGGFCGLTEKQVQKYKEMFAEPEDISPEEVEASIRFSFSPW